MGTTLESETVYSIRVECDRVSLILFWSKKSEIIYNEFLTLIPIFLSVKHCSVKGQVAGHIKHMRRYVEYYRLWKPYILLIARFVAVFVKWMRKNIIDLGKDKNRLHYSDIFCIIQEYIRRTLRQ